MCTLLLVEGVLLVNGVTGREPVVNRTGAVVYFECVDTFEAHVAHAEVRLVEVLAHELTVRRVLLLPAPRHGQRVP